VQYLDGPHDYQLDVNYDETATKQRLNNQKKVFARKEVILSAGVFNTPQILMLSGIGPKQHLSDLGIPLVQAMEGVGSSLSDHPEASIIHETNLAPLDPVAITKEYQANKTGLLTGNFIGLGWDWYPTVAPGGVGVDLIRPECHTHTVVGYFANYNHDDWWPLYNQSKHYVTNIIQVSLPQGLSGRVRLASPDPTQPPLLDESMASNDHDLNVLTGCLQVARKIWKQPEVAKYQPTEVWPGPVTYADDASLKQVLKYNLYGHNKVSGAKMGKPCDSFAVTNPNFQVYGLKGLRVVDNSILPIVPNGNPSHVAYALGEKAAGIIQSNVLYVPPIQPSPQSAPQPSIEPSPHGQCTCVVASGNLLSASILVILLSYFLTMF
jgi:choline dehydrogenase